MSTETENVYTLDIRIPDAPPQRIRIREKVQMGSSPDSDICIEGHGLSPIHCTWRVNNDVLSIHNMAADTFLEEQELSPGKMYILDKGDQVQIGDLEIFIRTEEIEVEDEFDDPQTNIQNIMDMKDKIEEKKENKRLGFFGRIAKKFKKEKKVNHRKARVKAKIKIKLDTPMAIGRTYGILASLSLTYAVVFTLVPLFDHENKIFSHISPLTDLYLEGLAKLKPMLPKDVNELFLIFDFFNRPEVASFLLTFLAIQIASAIVFGQNLHLTLIGVGSDDNLILKRLKGIIRNIIGFVTVPTIILELPLLIGKRGFKELLTFSRLEYSGNLYKGLGYYILYPLLIIAGPLSPIVNDMSILEGSLMEAPTKLSKNKSGSSKRIELNSEYFNLTLKSREDDKFVFLPSVEKNKKHQFSLYIQSLEKRGWVQIKRIKKLDIEKLINSMREQNPVAPLLNPIFSTKDGSLSSQDIIHLGTQALSLGPDNALDYLVEHGHFIKGTVDFRINLKKSVKQIDQPAYSFVNYAKTDYMKVGPKSLLPLNSNLYFPIQQKDAKAYEIIYKKNFVTLKNFVEAKLLLTSTLSKQAKNSSKKSKKVNIDNGLAVIDFLQNIEKKKISKGQAKQFIGFFKKMRKLDFPKAQVAFEKNMKSSLTSIISYLQNAEKRAKSKKLIRSMIKSLKKLNG